MKTHLGDQHIKIVNKIIFQNYQLPMEMAAKWGNWGKARGLGVGIQAYV